MREKRARRAPSKYSSEEFLLEEDAEPELEMRHARVKTGLRAEDEPLSELGPIEEEAVYHKEVMLQTETDQSEMTYECDRAELCDEQLADDDDDYAAESQAYLEPESKKKGRKAAGKGGEPKKRRVSRKVSQPAVRCDVTFPDLPADVLAQILKHLDHEDLDNAGQVNRLWRSALKDPWLRKHICERDFGHELIPFPEDQSYSMIYGDRLCYNCGADKTERTRTQGAKSGFRTSLCSQCIMGYDAERKGQRLLNKRRSMFYYRLRPVDLEGLPYTRVDNPVNPLYRSMYLYRRTDLTRASIRRWGSVEKHWTKIKPEELARKGLKLEEPEQAGVEK